MANASLLPSQIRTIKASSETSDSRISDTDRESTLAPSRWDVARPSSRIAIEASIALGAPWNTSARVVELQRFLAHLYTPVRKETAGGYPYFRDLPEADNSLFWGISQQVNAEFCQSVSHSQAN